MKTLSKKNSFIILFNYCGGFLFIYPFLLSLMATHLYFIFKVDLTQLILVAFYILFFIMMILAGQVILIDAWKQFKNKSWFILKAVFKNFLYSLLVSYLINFVISFLTTQTTSANQVIIEEGIQQNPIFIVLVALVFAPIVEELVFRGVIYNKVTIKHGYWLGAAISSILFGLLHVLDSLLVLNFNDIPFAIPYIALGFFIAKSYNDTGTIAGSILFHFLNNLLGVIMIFALR